MKRIGANKLTGISCLYDEESRTTAWVVSMEDEALMLCLPADSACVVISRDNLQHVRTAEHWTMWLINHGLLSPGANLMAEWLAEVQHPVLTTSPTEAPRISEGVDSTETEQAKPDENTQQS